MPPTGHIQQVNSVKTRDNLLISCSNDKTVKLWNLTNQSEIASLLCDVNSSAISLPGKKQVLVAEYSLLKLWDSQTGELVKEFRGHTNTIKWFSCSKTGEFIFSTGWDGKICKWDLKTGELLNTLTIGKSINCAQFIEADKVLLCADWDGVIHIWDLEQGKEIEQIKLKSFAIRSIALVQQNKYLIASSEDEKLTIWDTKTWKELDSVKIKAVDQFVLLPYSQKLAVLNNSKEIQIFSIFPLKKVDTINQKTFPTSIYVQKNEEYLVVGNSNGTIYLYKKK